MNLPVFAVIGHPNEGKSSVVATLAENDSIRISPTPGETMVSTAYPVLVDGQPVITFVDTPGFQNPLQTLGWMRKYEGPDEELLPRFLKEFENDPGLAHERELLRPVAEGAGVIYVLDASRPVRRVDLAEMEILRRTGRPRMAVLNCKTGEEAFLEEWKVELRKHFNIVRTFNALRATFAERVRLLESLRALEQDWEKSLDRIVDAFTRDWFRRNRECAALVCDFLGRVLVLSESATLGEGENRARLESALAAKLKERLRSEESRLHGHVCALFRHEATLFDLPEHSVLHQDLFGRTTWRVLGLNRAQLVTAATAAGAATGVAVDLATLGTSLGVFAAVGGAITGLAALFKGEKLARHKIMGLELGQRTVRVGPVGTVQWMFILLDRFLLHYWYVIRWAHALRDHGELSTEVLAEREKLELNIPWDRPTRKLCADYFQARQEGDDARLVGLEQELRRFIEDELKRLSFL
ncbi:MAG: DUF3482 domain-containing protein [Deltaproteobacteria bacterium]|nr:DUF3482 domain-containing protein [Deltaproteobacteria bacterium]